MNKPPRTVTVYVPSYLEPGNAETIIAERRAAAAESTLHKYRKMVEISLDKLKAEIPYNLIMEARQHVTSIGIDANMTAPYQWLLELHTVIRRIARRSYPKPLQKYLPGLCLEQLDKFFKLYPPTPGERKTAAASTTQQQLQLD